MQKKWPKSPKILIAISGSISAYKMADVVSTLKKEGCEVKCVLTKSASQFVSPLVLETLSGHSVYSEMWQGLAGTEHIDLARWPDLMVFAPASAHLIARLAHGLADDLVTTVALATRVPKLLAPAMNTAMLENPLTQKNLATLREQGFQIVEPDSGKLACGEEGSGKLASVERIVENIYRTWGKKTSATEQNLLSHQHYLITAGPTLSRIDPVRYLTNRSTGKMGVALAEKALEMGAQVTLILGQDKGTIQPSPESQKNNRLCYIQVETADQMLQASLGALKQVTAVIAAAAVLDYQVKQSYELKQKRGTVTETQIELVQSVDVLKELRNATELLLEKNRPWFLGFAAETHNELENAYEKINRKRLDFLFVNTVSSTQGFGSDENTGTLLTRTHSGIQALEIPLQSKYSLAETLLKVTHETIKNRY